MVEVKRFELWTFRTSSECSNQLSYTSDPAPVSPKRMRSISYFFSLCKSFFNIALRIASPDLESGSLSLRLLEFFANVVVKVFKKPFRIYLVEKSGYRIDPVVRKLGIARNIPELGPYDVLADISSGSHV